MAAISDAAAFIGRNIASILLLFTILRLASNYIKPGVSAVPGPLLAKLSNIWRFVDVSKGHAEVTLLKLHRKYGDYVRLGPNVVSVQNLDAIKVIYGINKGYEKTDFYKVQQQLAKGKPTPTLFTTTDERFHAAIKRPISAAYSMSTLTEFEPFVNKTISTFFKKLNGFADRNQYCDIATWLQYYAFDVIGELTFSKSLGFLEKGSDVDGIIKALEAMLNYSGKVGQIPWLDYVFIKNPLRRFIQGGTTGAVAQFARARLDERLQQSGSGAKAEKGREVPRHRDFLARFLEAKDEYPKIVNDQQVFSYTVSNMNAGSDTTAISLRAILYYVLKSPRVASVLQAELDVAFKEGKIDLPVSWKQSQKELPYLDAVIREALRLHPAVGLLLERKVPQGGFQLPNNGPYLPAGTIVGANPWIIHRHALFGEHVDSFIPERWLPTDDESESKFQSRKSEMIRATFTFGAGPRTCIGKNISLLEIYKLIPSLFLTYEISLKNPEKEWKTTNAWFVRQEGMDVVLKRRDLPEI